MHRRIVAAFTVCVAVAAWQPAAAWDDHGHRVVALLADRYLLPEAREKIAAMLAADTDRLAPHDIAGAATWADKYLDSDQYTTRERYDATRRWHFADIDAVRPNIPAACFGQRALTAGTPASQGPAEACVIDKITQFTAALADPKTDAAERLLALKYLLHLVGDVHQPLRVANEHNDHGTALRVSAEDKSITPGTLFGYWDIAFGRSLGPDPSQVAAKLADGITEEDRNQWSGRVVHLWALDAHQLGVNYAYGTNLSTPDPLGHYSISADEIKRSREIVAKQLSKAGVRLAMLLNDALVPTSRPVLAYGKPPAGNVRSGRELALASCSVCHMVLPNQRSPRNFTTAPDFAAVANTAGMSDAALREFLFGPHPTMPSLALTGQEANNVIAFILSLRAQP